MTRCKFPRTYADLDAAPWCDGYDPPKGQVSEKGDHLSIFIKPDWLPPDYREMESPGGSSLKDALKDLRSVWTLIRPPSHSGGDFFYTIWREQFS